MYEENEKKKSPIGVVFSALFFGIFLFIMCSIIFNSCRMSDSDICDDVIFDDRTYEAYNSSPEDFSVEAYDIEKRFEAVEANQLLQLKYLYYIPSAKQMQVTIKYNTSYAETTDSTELPLNLTLKNHTGEILDDFFFVTDVKDGYGYIRICWNNVEFSDKSEYTLHVTQKKGDKEVNRGSFLMQKATTAHKEIKLTKKNAPEIIK
ncbi:MAG: hypothetical protein IKU43_05730 [Clostridia bacterium]|nr:hypothetical protein [Clostridia bacterium]